jgi:hypothetical protein
LLSVGLTQSRLAFSMHQLAVEVSHFCHVCFHIFPFHFTFISPSVTFQLVFSSWSS